MVTCFSLGLYGAISPERYGPEKAKWALFLLPTSLFLERVWISTTGGRRYSNSLRNGLPW